MLQPLVRRTWAPRGQTPLLRQWERHDRLSVASGLTVAPCRRRLGLYWRMQPKNIRAVDLVHFLRSLRRHLRRPLVLILDRWSVHKAELGPASGIHECSEVAGALCSAIPIRSSSLRPVEIVAGDMHTCALGADGTAYC